VSGRLAGFFRLRHTPDQFQMPLSVQVGEGETAVPVSLDRFRPLGRIDFTIDFPEFAAAINQAARRTETAICARGEQLQNGDFARWRTIGQRFGPLQDTGLQRVNPRTVTIAPNGEWALLGQVNGAATVVNLPWHRSNFVNFPAPASPQQVAISSDSQRIYLFSTAYESPDALYLIDATTFMPLGEPVQIDGTIDCLTLSPDDRILYASVFQEVWAIDTAVLSQLLTSGTDVNLADARVGNPIPLTEGFQPVSLAVSPDGRRLFVAAADQAFTFDTTSHQLLADPIPVAGTIVGLALTPDGRRLLVLIDNNTVSLIDAARLLVEDTIDLPDVAVGELQPVAIEIEPNGRRAFVASYITVYEGPDTALISVIDLDRLEAGRSTTIGAIASLEVDLAVTPAGDRLYVALSPDLYSSPEMSGLRFLPLGVQHPDHWTLTTGFVMPIPFGDPFHLTALLGPVTAEERDSQPVRPSALSQAVAVVGDCTYDFSFWGISNGPDAVAEVIWRGGACAIQRTDRIPIQMPKIEARPERRPFPKAGA
jgi:DNA-binding beta-propeller fold protein YncE